jgi:cytochrome P450
MVGRNGGDTGRRLQALDEARRSNEELVEYVSRVIAERRKEPRDDLISRLVAARSAANAE